MILGLLVAVVFTVSLSETIDGADGFVSKSTAGWVYELTPGDSQVLTWTLTNTEEESIDIEFNIVNEGSELFIFEKIITFEPKETKSVEFIVVIPDTHPDNIEYRVDLFALERAQAPEGAAAAILINYKMVAHSIVKIGNNPVFTPEPLPVVEEEPEPIVQERPKDDDLQIIPTESLEEKLERIKAANEMTETSTVDSSLDEKIDTKNNDAANISESEFTPEPMMDTKPMMKDQSTIDDVDLEKEDGGCLIATAAFGSELAPQVQLLREIRDNQLMNSEYGLAFMSGFNQLYYSFSPHIADLERQSPAFKELVKLTITPMISTLSIMQYADSDDTVLGLGIGVILMNLGMYVGLPTFGIVKLIQFRKK